ncbi:MAG: APC family permease [Limnobacter sp.]|nr:APC family permease [Limnobacter sp.]
MAVHDHSRNEAVSTSQPEILDLDHARRNSVFSKDYAWMAVAACGLASIAFGPEAAFLALDGANHLLLLLGVLTAVCILLVSLTYFQVTELFPKGGGGYAMSTQLLGPFVGLVAGAALLVDYVIMVAMGVSASARLVFTFLPPHWYELHVWLALAALLVLLRFQTTRRGLPLRLIRPLFLAFLFSHVLFILVGLSDHFQDIGGIIDRSVGDTTNQIGVLGLLGVIGVFAKGFFLGGGTFTGIEAATDCIQLSNVRQSGARRKKLLVYVACAWLLWRAVFLHCICCGRWRRILRVL